MTATKTKSEQAAADIAALLRARNALIWVVTREEARVERYLFEAAASAGYLPRTWDCGQGVCGMDGRVDSTIGGTDISETLRAIDERSRQEGRSVWILRDLPMWLQGPIGMQTLRQVRNLARSLPGVPRESAAALVILSPSSEVPPELAGHATVIDFPLPDRTEIAAILDAALDALPEEYKASAAPNGQRDAAIDAAVGLNGEEAASCYAKSLVQLRRIDPVTVATEKKRVIARERVLEWIETLDSGLSGVGGLEGLKKWLVARSSAYSPRARAYGLPAPKGVLLVGVPGCGKTLVSKAIAAAYGVPLLKLDLGSLKGRFVGESEQNLRKALNVISAIGRCVILVDEIEKSMAGAVDGGADAGVSADQLSTLLNWLQEKSGDSFLIATSNDITKLPSELTRKGRFDEIFFVDLPNESERKSVLAATLRKHSRDKLKIDATKVAAACDGFSGAEVAEIVSDAMFVAFADGEREITTDDLVNSAATVIPLSKSSADKVAKLREWAKTRARPATTAEVATTEKRRAVRALDI